MNMKRLIVAVLLIVPSLLPIAASSVLAEVPFHAFTTTGTRAFNACLYAAWVDDYCRNIAFWSSQSYGESFLACVDANKGGKFPLAGRSWYNTEEYCRIRAQGR
jgi:hypothetical protein